MILPGKRVPVRTHFRLVLSGKSIFYLPPPSSHPLPFFPLHPQFYFFLFFIFYFSSFFFLLLFILFFGCVGGGEGGGEKGGERGGGTIAIAAAAAPGYKYKLNFYLKFNFK